MASPADPTSRPRRQLPTNHLATSLQPPSHGRGRSSRSGTATPTTGSATQTLTNASPRESHSPEPMVLRLRGAHQPSTTETARVKWAEDVVDNEGLGRKSSKVCCIYHKPGDESSEDSSSGSDSDGSGDDGSARPVGGKRKGGRRNGRDPGDGHDHNHNHGKRKPSPNAYEKQPKAKPAKP